MQTQGIYFVNKQVGYTSHAMLDYLKSKHNIKKLGHTGTLDKFAEGCMCVLAGQYTRLQRLFLKLDKRYTCQATFGVETDTLDRDGALVKKMPLPKIEDIIHAFSKVSRFTTQVPPQYSAIHVHGVRAYKSARQKKEVILPNRPIKIFHLKLLDIELPHVRFDVHVSSGTYVRAIVRDIATEANSCAYVTKLTRIAIGPFTQELFAPMDSEYIESQNDKKSIDALQSHRIFLSQYDLAQEEYKAEFENETIRELYFNDQKRLLVFKPV